MTSTSSTPSDTPKTEPTPVQAAAVTAMALMRVDPQALMVKAIESDAGIETLERLMALAEQWRAITAREAFYAAKARFLAECPAIKKGSTAEVRKNGAVLYTYSYSELGDILAVVGPLLGRNGLSVSWKTPKFIEGSKPNETLVVISCVLTHELGHSEDSGEISMPVSLADADRGANPAQRVGMALTYAKRYTLLAILGIAPESDPDARGAGGDDEREERQEPEQEQRGNGQSGAVISEAQDRRFWAIAHQAQWEDAEVGQLLQDWQYAKSPQIRRSEYDAIVNVLKDGPEKFLDKRGRR